MKVITFDWDKPDTWHYCSDGNTVASVSREEFLTAEFISQYAGMNIRMEKAHLEPRKELSVSQVYSQEELDKLLVLTKEYGVTISLLPERQSRRACEDTLHMDNAENDVEARQTSLFEEEEPEGTEDIYDSVDEHRKSKYHRMARCLHRFYDLNTKIPARRWPLARHNYISDIKNECNYILNLARPKYEDNFSSAIRRRIDEIYDTLPSAVLDAFDIKRQRSGRLKIGKVSAVMSIAAAMFDREGRQRTNPAGNPLGVKKIWEILGQNAFGIRSVARSNINYHFVRNKTKGSENFRESRKDLRRAMKLLIKTLRDSAQGKIKSPLLAA